MDLTYLTSDDWDAVQREYPGAISMLRELSLQGEHRYLAGLTPRTNWHTRRLAELDEHFKARHYAACQCDLVRIPHLYRSDCRTHNHMA